MTKFKTIRLNYKKPIMIFIGNNSYILQNNKWVDEELKTFDLQAFDNYNITSRIRNTDGLLYITLEKGEENKLSKKEFLLFVREDIYQDIILKHKITPTVRIMQELVKLTNNIYEEGKDWQENGNIAMQILSFLRLLHTDPNKYMEELYEIIEGDFIE